jgi:hypothetical protein
MSQRRKPLSISEEIADVADEERTRVLNANREAGKDIDSHFDS